MAETISLRINTLAYTVPTNFIPEPMRSVFELVAESCEIKQRLPADYPSAPAKGLLPVLYDDLVRATTDHDFLARKKQESLNQNRWFFNEFIIPNDYTGPKLHQLPNVEIWGTESIEVITKYEGVD